MIVMSRRHTVTTYRDINPLISSGSGRATTTAPTGNQVTIPTGVERGLIIDTLGGMLHHGKGAKMSFADNVSTLIN